MDNNKRLELARDWYNDQSTTKKEKVLLENLFPELQESEDEKIRKEIIDFLIHTNKYGSNEKCESWLAWLEKHAEQKPADKFEPKFKVGDWVAIEEEIGLCTPLHIVDMDDKQYRVEQTDGSSGTPNIDYLDRLYHPWTLEEARDGDVLVIESGRRNDECFFIFKDIADREVLEHCYYRTSDGTFSPTGSYIGYLDNVYHPATKEQRDLLFQKMKEAGYEWDDNEKALVMIGVDNDEEDERYEELMEDDETSIKQNPEWSEEDEKMLDQVMQSMYRYQDHLIGSPLADDVEIEIKWLKSIKPQPHWKPTQEQIYALSMAYKDSLTSGENLTTQTETLKSLYNDLKKL